MGDPTCTSSSPSLPVALPGPALGWSRSVVLFFFAARSLLCSPSWGPRLATPLQTSCTLSPFGLESEMGQYQNSARRWDAAEDPPSCLQMSVPCLKTISLLPPPRSAAHLLHSMFLCGSPHCSLNKHQDHLWSAPSGPPGGFPPPFLRGKFPQTSPKTRHTWGHLLLSKGRSLGVMRQASTKRGGNRLGLAV